MGKHILFFSLLLLCLAGQAQLDNLKIGYQEFPTTVKGHAVDSAGNMYYSGTFKGELTINKQVLQTGAGLEDIFFAKTDTKGNLLYAKSFGSKGSDFALRDGLVSFNNSLYLGTTVSEEVSFQSFVVSPYVLPNGGPTGCVLRLDTSGNVKWVARTSLSIQRVYAANNIIHVTGGLPTGSALYNDQVLYDNLPAGSMVHLMLDTLGNLLNSKVTSPKASGQYVESPLYFSHYSDGKLCLLLRVTGNTSFQFGGMSIPLPSAMNNYYLLVKTDTAYSNVAYKLLNSPGVVFNNDNGLGLPMTLSPQDSLYFVLTSENPSASVSYDGLTATVFKKNVLVVVDPSLKANRIVQLGDPVFANAPASQRRLVFRSVNTIKNNLFFTGNYTGVNESPVAQIPEVDSTITVVPNLTAVIDLNGSSRSFAMKTSVDFTGGKLTWLGDHTPYETATLYPEFAHVANDSLLVFSYQVDNVWNPRIVDQNTNPVLGGMTRTADLPERIKSVVFLPDASRVVLGTAQGRTAFDTANTPVKCNLERSDAFLARLSPKGEVLWYKRLASTLLSASPMRLAINGNKIYFLVNYNRSVNESNSIVVDQKVYKVGTSASLVGSIDASGTLGVINLENSNFRDAVISDFTLCSNGDLLLLTQLRSPVTYASTTSTVPHLLRVDPSTNTIGKARRLISSSVYAFYPSHVEVDNNDVMYVSLSLGSAGSTQDQYGTLSYFDGNNFLGNIPIENNVAGISIGGLGILKLSWEKLLWYKRTSSDNFFGFSTMHSPIFSVKDKLLVVAQPASIYGGPSTSAFYWDHKLILPQMDNNKAYIFRMDTDENVDAQKEISDFSIRSTKRKVDGTILISGSTRNATRIDTIAVGFDGQNDAFGFAIDTSFKVKRSFRLATPYNEFMEDMDLYKDSLVSFAYTAQTTPVLKPYRTATLPNDYAADAFLSTQILIPQAVLPLQLFSFGAERKENRVDIHWTVAANEEGREYTLQRAYNRGAFKNIGTRTAEKNTSMANYTWKDQLMDYGIYMYRLLLVAQDGTVTYSKVVPINYAANMGSFYYDNGRGQLHIVRPDQKAYSWKVFELGSGRLLLSGKGAGDHIIDVGGLAKGGYVVQTIDTSANEHSYTFLK